MKKYAPLLFAALCTSALSLGQKLRDNTQAGNGASYFPAAQFWEHRNPATLGIDSNKMAEAIAFAKSKETSMPSDQELAQAMTFGKEPFSDPLGPLSSRGEETGVIIYKGYIIAEWGDPKRVDMANSVTKSMLSTVVGLAIHEGLIGSVHDTVANYVPAVEVYDPANAQRTAASIGQPQFLYPFSSTHNKAITWDHLLRQTSDWEGILWGKPDWADRPGDKPAEWLTRTRNPPGTAWKYNDTRVNVLALAATFVWRRPLPQILREKVMNPIGASNSWFWAGYRNAWVVVDGQLIQSVSGGGHYGGGLFINAYDMARFGLLTLHRGRWKDKQVIDEQWVAQARTPTTANPSYGYMNWYLNTGQKLFANAPPSAFAHIGNGTNIIYVDPDHDLVAVVRWIDSDAVNGFIKLLLEGIK